MSELSELNAIISGRVQMVMYRDFVCRNARSLGLVGKVRNCADGTVEVVAQGDKVTLENFVALLHKGSILSSVDGVVVAWRQPSVGYNGFHIIYE